MVSGSSDSGRGGSFRVNEAGRESEGDIQSQ